MKVSNKPSPRHQQQIRAYQQAAEKIMGICGEYHGVTVDMMKSRNRNQTLSITSARAIAVTIMSNIFKRCDWVVLGLLISEPDKPRDHSATRQIAVRLEGQINDKTPMGHYMNPGLRNDYKACYERCVSALRDPSEHRKGTETVHFRFNSKLYQQAQRYCKEHGITMNGWVRGLMQNELGYEL